jgi:hypothetical protein
LLDILEEFDFYVRYTTIKLLATLVANRSKRIQECILTNPMGISRLVDLLDDKRDIIRNGKVDSNVVFIRISSFIKYRGVVVIDWLNTQ